MMRKYENRMPGYGGNPKIQDSSHDTQSDIFRSESRTLNFLAREREERQTMLRFEELAKTEGLRENRARVRIPSSIQASIDSKANDSEVFKKNGTVVLDGPFTFRELLSEPDDPIEGHAVMWMSNGEGSGDEGDIMIKITAGGVTKIYTLVDFSAI